ncbi:MAG: N-6 DNA methylase [Phycisphaerae bacterium]|nr:N-6 DNA methylase [Phycisphaerae bacterium]
MGVDVDALTEQTLEKVVSEYRGFGAPVLFTCGHEELQWWSFTTQKPTLKGKISADKVTNFFNEHRQDFAPENIYRAKTIGRLNPQYQLTFVDVGLMPLFEYEMGDHLSKLIRKMCDVLHNEIGKPDINEFLGRWLFQSVFRLLAAKILRDKEVPEFSDLNMEDVSDTLRKVHNHYNAGQPTHRVTPKQESGLKEAAKLLKNFGSLRHLTIESLAYVYENDFITKDIRKALGIHATPSYLVDYIVWKLAPWIEDIPRQNRVVLEPTCGHAPFLISAARLLREMIDENDPKKRHDYLKDHLIGLELDSFAREIARLSLTLADVPNPNGWQLLPADVYKRQVLSKAASNATILLCNPPFQNFTPEEKRSYTEKDITLQYGNKSAEVLGRTLPYMPPGSVFGVILPRSFLESKNAIPLREMLVKDFRIYEICVLPDNVFPSADHESAVILGRKRVSKRITNKVRFVRVREKTLDEFRNRYIAPTEVIEQSRFIDSDDCVLSVPELDEVWSFCQSFNRLKMVVDERRTGKGLEYNRSENLPVNTETISTQRFKGSIRGYAKFDEEIKLTGTPKLYWLNLADGVIRRPGHGRMTGIPQILLNSAPVSRGPWRLKALIDNKGYPVTSSFILIRPKKKGWSLEVLWAILNSPLANAYIYCYGTKRIVGVKRILSLPIPNMNANDLYFLSELVQDYFKIFQLKCGILQSEIDAKEAHQKMVAIDAEVMRLYDLPPRLERQVLDLSSGWQRRGVDFKFERYYPKDFESWIPLHEYLSEDYQRSTISFVSKWVEDTRSPEIIKAFKAAEEAFKED